MNAWLIAWVAFLCVFKPWSMFWKHFLNCVSRLYTAFGRISMHPLNKRVLPVYNYFLLLPMWLLSLYHCVVRKSVWEGLWRNEILPVSHRDRRDGEWNEGLYLGDWRAGERKGLLATSQSCPWSTQGLFSTCSVQGPAPSFRAEPIKRVLPGLQYFVDNIRWSWWIVRRWRRVQGDWTDGDYWWSLECGRFHGWDSGERVGGFHRAWLETILFTSQITGSPPLLSDLDILCEMEHEGHRGSSRLNKSEEAWSLMWNAICC